MWISNTATTAMMVPIAHAVLMELERDSKRQQNREDGTGLLSNCIRLPKSNFDSTGSSSPVQKRKHVPHNSVAVLMAT